MIKTNLNSEILEKVKKYTSGTEPTCLCLQISVLQSWGEYQQISFFYCPKKLYNTFLINNDIFIHTILCFFVCLFVRFYLA